MVTAILPKHLHLKIRNRSDCFNKRRRFCFPERSRCGTGARGVVTTATQTFGGNKAFQDSVNARKTILVGATGNANSTVQVSGSLSMAVTTITANYTLTAADNTVLANTTSAALIVTLPAPGSIAGRIYTIKKIGNRRPLIISLPLLPLQERLMAEHRTLFTMTGPM